MNKMIKGLITGMLLTGANVSLANDIEGVIESVDPVTQSIVVQGITFYAKADTDYDDGLRSFADLAPGQKVEVDFYYHDGKHFIEEIELDD